MAPTVTTRRTFVHTGALALASAALGVGQTRRSGQPSDRFRVAVIGAKGMGSSDMRSMLKVDGVECAMLCDVDESVLAEKAADFEESTGVLPELTDDYRRVLERDDIDAVIVATPDHWHCRIMVDALSAGKHVYCEKPMANTIEEIEIMRKAAAYYGRAVQIGQWQRSGKHWDDAMEYLWSGAIGEVRQTKAWAFMDWDAPPRVADGKPPEGVDYEMWLGPAPKRAFNENRFHWNWRWYWDYAGGLMTDWGVHLIDIVLYGMKANAPKSVMSLGGAFGYPDGGMETPDTQQAIYEFDGFSMTWEHAVGIGLGPFQRGHGVAFVGNKATLVVDRSGWEIFPEKDRSDRSMVRYRTEALPRRGASPSARGLDQHTENFVECAKSGEQPRCNAEIGAIAAINAHLGNIAFKTGERVYWDDAKGAFTGSAEANQLLKAEYHNGWTLPRVPS